MRPARPRRWSAEARGDPHRLQPGQAAGRVVARNPGESRSRPPPARPRWSGWSRRSRSPAPPCAGPAARARWRGPARRGRGRRKAARLDGRVAQSLGQALGGAQDLALAGQEDQHAAGLSASAVRTARATWSSSRSARIAAEVAGLDRDTAAPGSRSPAHRPAGRATRAPSRVADITSSRRSSRSSAWPSRAKARPRSASRLRSWNSSNSTAATPSRPGSSRIMRVKTPSVTTSIRVRAETRDCMRTRKPTVSPTASPRRRGHARGGRPRGQAPRLQHDQLAAAAQGSSSSARGVTVVLPAPGGATSTAPRFARQRRLQRRQRLVDGQHGRRCRRSAPGWGSSMGAARRPSTTIALAELRVPHAVGEIDHDARPPDRPGRSSASPAPPSGSSAGTRT